MSVRRSQMFFGESSTRSGYFNFGTIQRLRGPLASMRSAQKVDFEMDSSRCNYRLVGAALASIEAYETCFRQLV